MARHPPSIGVLGSGRLANTTSTYSSCSRSSDAFRPAAPRAPLGVAAPAGEAAGGDTAWHRGQQHLASIPTFYDVLSGQAPLRLSPGKGKVGESLAHSGRSATGRVRYLLSAPEDFGGDDQAGPSAGRKRGSSVAAPAKPRAHSCPGLLRWLYPAHQHRRDGFATQEYSPAYLHPFFLMMFPSTTSALQEKVRSAAGTLAAAAMGSGGSWQGWPWVPSRLRGKRGGHRDTISPLHDA